MMLTRSFGGAFSDLILEPTMPLTHAPAALAASLLIASSVAAQEAAAAPPPPTLSTLTPFGYAVLSRPASAWPPVEFTAPPATDAPSSPPPAKERSFAIDLGAATELPIMVGAQATVELPYRLLLQGEIGALPSAYVNAMDRVLVAAGAYDASTSTLVKGALQRSLIGRVSAGFRPFAGHGLEIMGGYTHSSLSGAMGARQAILAATGYSMPTWIPDSQIELRSRIHSLHASLGWRWVIADHFFIRAQVAYMQSIGSSSRLVAQSELNSLPVVSTRIVAVNQAVDATLNDKLTKYVKLPVIGLSMGCRL
jgi:hypothetical protein